MRYVKFDTFAFFVALAVMFAAVALLGCNMPTEGYPCETDGCETSSSDDGTSHETITPLPTTATTDPSVSSTTSEPDVTTGASVMPGTDGGSGSTGMEESSGVLPEESSTSGEQGSGESGSESSGIFNESSTGEELWEFYDDAHCGPGCADEQIGAAVDACICAPLCMSDEQCDAPAKCLGGRCAIPCEENYVCSWTTSPEFVCGAMANGWHACMYEGEP